MKKTLFFIVIFTGLVIGAIFVLTPLGWKADLISPMGQKEDKAAAASSSEPVAQPVAPKTFNFDSTTDLKEELEKVNPQVLDSDFE